MSPKVLLRIASIILFFKAIGHTLYIVTWKETTDTLQSEIVKQMAVHKFPFGGTSRSFADYYNGFGYILSVVFMMIAITLWMVSDETKSGEKFPKKIVFITAFTLLAMGIIELLLFFPFVMILSLVAGALTLFAGFRLNRTVH
jgi:hypothetical protein